MLDTKLLDRTGLEICVVVGDASVDDHQPGVTNTTTLTSAEIKGSSGCVRCCFYVDSAEEANLWLSVLIRCTLPFSFLSSSVSSL